MGGICQCCGNVAPALIGCKACGSRVCHKCFDPKSGFCSICGGGRKLSKL